MPFSLRAATKTGSVLVSELFWHFRTNSHTSGQKSSERETPESFIASAAADVAERFASVLRRTSKAPVSGFRRGSSSPYPSPPLCGPSFSWFRLRYAWAPRMASATRSVRTTDESDERATAVAYVFMNVPESPSPKEPSGLDLLRMNSTPLSMFGLYLERRASGAPDSAVTVREV